MNLKQNDREHLVDMVQQDKMTADEANVAMVRTQRVRLVVGTLPMQVRKPLNAAVKGGELGHMKKEGYKPEAYFHPTFDYLAKAERNKHERSILEARSGVLVRASDL